MTARTLYDKIWDDHLVDEAADGTCLLYIDRHLVHEVTSPQAFEGLRMAGRRVRRPELTLAVPEKAIGHDKRSQVHLWVVPARLQGLWCGPGGVALRVQQRFQAVQATLVQGAEQRALVGRARERQPRPHKRQTHQGLCRDHRNSRPP